MFRHFYKRSNLIKAPIDGKVISLQEVPDPAFSKQLLGNGLAIIPNDPCVVSPCNGYISVVANTKHAIGITTAEGLQLLIHVGLNTMHLNGNGFELLVKIGDIVSIGTPLLMLQPSLFNQKDICLITPIVICNSDTFTISKYTKRQLVEAGVHTIFEYHQK